MPVRIIVISAPSGAGKTTLAQRLLKRLPQLAFAISVTTRPARNGEMDGKDYYFVTRPHFDLMITNDALLEYEEVYSGIFYGTPNAEMDRACTAHPLLLDVDVHGALTIRERYGAEAFTVFIRPPTLEHLKVRLRDRGTETPASLRQRIDRARHEMQCQDQFDAIVVNDDLYQATETLVALVSARIA